MKTISGHYILATHGQFCDNVLQRGLRQLDGLAVVCGIIIFFKLPSMPKRYPDGHNPTWWNNHPDKLAQAIQHTTSGTKEMPQAKLSSEFRRKGWTWGILLTLVTGLVGWGLGIMTVNWFPHYLLAAQILFIFSALAMVVKFALSAIEAGGSTIRNRVLFALIPSSIVIAVFTALVTVIQIHKYQAISGAASISQDFVSNQGSIGTLNQSGNSFVGSPAPDSHPNPLIRTGGDNGEVTVKDSEGCNLGYWECGLRYIHKNSGDTTSIERFAVIFERHLQSQASASPFMNAVEANRCREEIRRDVQWLIDSPTDEGPAIEKVHQHQPSCVKWLK